MCVNYRSGDAAGGEECEIGRREERGLVRERIQAVMKRDRIECRGRGRRRR